MVEWQSLSREETNVQFSACKHSSLDFYKHTVSDLTLICSGAKFEVVSEVETANKEKTSASDWADIFSFWPCSLLDRDKTRPEVLWRTLICNLTNKSQRPSHDFETNFRDHIHSLIALRVIERELNGERQYPKIPDANIIQHTPETREYVRLLRAKTAGNESLEDKKELQRRVEGGLEYGYATLSSRRGSNRLFKTEQGHLGLGPCRIESGDEVWVLCNTRVPFILRPTDVPGQYNLVSECYMHGFMHGQLVKGRHSLLEKIKKIKIV